MKKLPYLLVVFLVICSCTSESSIKSQALRSSVQITTYLPVIKVSFTKPLAKDEPFSAKLANEILDKKIESARDELRKEVLAELEKAKEERYETSITSIETWVEDPRSKTEIPIGSLKGVPTWARYLERVLVVYKTESAEIKPWDKEAEKDVLAISETAGVSISKAKEMLTKIRAEGYTVSKETVKEDAEIAFLWYHTGWDSSYPTVLKWSVIVEGTTNNILIGYDDRGLLRTKPIPEKKKVFVSSGYFDLKDKFKPRSSEMKSLDSEVDRLKKLKDDLEKERDKLKEEVRAKELKEMTAWARDITNATMMDVMYGTVKVEMFWTESIGTGLYIGNARLANNIRGVSDRYGVSAFFADGTDYGMVLTNAHVAKDSISREFFVTDDHEVMYVVGPGAPFVRYTDESDTVGSPAWVLAPESVPMLSRDYDCAVMVTERVPGMEKSRAILGDSDRVEQGDKVIFSGNPHGYQKILSSGNITKAGYSMMDSRWGEYYFKFGGKLTNVKKIWHDAINSHGGTSGSGVFAASGHEVGKVIGLHHAGLRTAVTVSEARIQSTMPVRTIPVDDGVISGWEGLIKDISAEQMKKLFANYPFTDAKFETIPMVLIKETDSHLSELLTKAYMYALIPIPGMACAIPINPIKQYLQERGLDPAQFGFEGLSSKKQEG